MHSQCAVLMCSSCLVICGVCTGGCAGTGSLFRRRRAWCARLLTGAPLASGRAGRGGLSRPVAVYHLSVHVPVCIPTLLVIWYTQPTTGRYTALHYSQPPTKVAVAQPIEMRENHWHISFRYTVLLFMITWCIAIISKYLTRYR